MISVLCLYLSCSSVELNLIIISIPYGKKEYLFVMNVVLDNNKVGDSLLLVWDMKKEFWCYNE